MNSVKGLFFPFSVTLLLLVSIINIKAQDKKLEKFLNPRIGLPEFKEAEAYCAKKKAEEQKDCYTTLYNAWGDHELKWYDYEEASIYYEKANNIDGLIQIAEYHYKLRHWEELTNIYEIAYKNDPEKLNVIEQYLEAKKELAKERKKELIDSLKRALENAPKLIYEDYALEIDFATFSPDGKYILSGGDIDLGKMGKYPIHLWDTETGKMVRSFGEVKTRGDAWIQKVEFTPDGKNIVSVGRELKLINFKTGKVSWRKQGFFYQSVISDNGKYLATVEDKFLTLIDTQTGKTLKSVYGTTGDRIQSLDFSPDGKYIVTCDYKDEERAIRIWNAETLELRKTLKGHLKEVERVIFSPDGKYILSGSSDGTLKLWDIDSGDDIKTFRNKTGGGVNVYNFYFSLNGKSIITSTGNMDVSQIINIDIKTEEVNIIKECFSFQCRLSDFTLSPDGKFILTTDGESIKLFEVNSNVELPKMISFDNYDDWLLITNDGRFDGSKGAMEKIYYEVNNDYLPLELFYERDFTPNLFSKIIDGESLRRQRGLDMIRLPPSLKVNTSNGSNLTSHQKNIEISITATDRGGGIDEIRLYQNAKLISSKNINGNGNSLITNVTLVSEYEGKNYFKAVALSKDRTESKPETFVITYTGIKDSKPDLYLFAVGINDYKNSKYNLNYAQADAQAITNELGKDDDFLFGNKHITLIENSHATKINILNAFNEIKNQILEQDVFIFYYAGHGVLSEGSIDDKNYYLILHDVINMYGDVETLANKGLSTEELKELSKNLNAQKQIFLMDACQSGGGVELLARRGIVEEKAIAQLARSTGTFWLAASESEQFATEFEALRHGVFTYSILEGLSGKADTGKDGIITVKELSMFLERIVPELSMQYKNKQQYPLVYGFGQDFPLILNRK